jgi:O-antigen/teichoic acid export membrane protein
MAWMFTPEDIGRMNLFGVTLSFFLLLLLLGLDVAYVREYHSSRDQSELLRACFIPGALLYIILIFGSFYFASDISEWIFGISDPALYFLLLACIAANYISRFFSLILRMQERGLAFSMSQIMPKLLQLLLLGVIFFLGVARDFLTLLWIATASMMTVVLVYAWNTRRDWMCAIGTHPTSTQFKTLIKFGFPLIFSGLAYWGLSATSALVLSRESSLEELGVFALTSSFAGVAMIFQSIFSMMWAPTVFKWVHQEASMKRVDAIARKALFIVCFMLCLVGMFSWIIDYVLPASYLNVKYYVVCAIVPAMLYTLSEITGIGLTVVRRTDLVLWSALSALSASITLNFLLVPTYGAAGAVVANSISYVVLFVVRTEASIKVWRVFPRGRFYSCVVVFVGLAVATVWVGPSLPIHYSLLWVFTLPFLLFLFKSDIAEILMLINKSLPVNKI